MIWNRVETALKKYKWIMAHVYKCDVSVDPVFQKTFNGFYRIRQKPASFYQSFYRYLEDHKNNHLLSFEDVLTHLYHESGSIYASFSSKLLATVNPNMPVWDKFVLQNLGLRAPYYYENDRLSKTVLLYQQICDWYRTEEASQKLKLFNSRFPNTDITDVKKIDLVLWATR